MDNEALFKLIVDMKESLEREMRDGFDKVNQKMDRRFEQIDRRFDQVNSRLVRVDTVWKVARDWGRSVDNHDIESDAVIAQLVKQVAALEQRLSRLENKQQ